MPQLSYQFPNVEIKHAIEQLEQENDQLLFMGAIQKDKVLKGLISELHFRLEIRIAELYETRKK